MALTSIQSIIKSIGEFYLQKNNGDVKKANEEVDRLKITKIEFRECENMHLLDLSKLYITTMRPGMLIGKRGEEIENLTKHLNCHIHIIEEMDLGLLYSDERDPDEVTYDRMMDSIYEEECKKTDDLNYHLEMMDSIVYPDDYDYPYSSGKDKGDPY